MRRYQRLEKAFSDLFNQLGCLSVFLEGEAIGFDVAWRIHEIKEFLLEKGMTKHRLNKRLSNLRKL